MDTYLSAERRRLGLYLPHEAATALKVSRNWLQNHRCKFPPTHLLGCRLHYSEDDLQRMREYLDETVSRPHAANRGTREIAKERGWYRQQEVAQLLGVSGTWLRHHKDKFPPRHQICKSLFYDEEDIDRMREYLSQPRQSPAEMKLQKIEAEGLLSIKGAARLHGIPSITWSVNIQEGRVPRPTHRRGAAMYYTRDEAAEIADMLHRRAKLEHVDGRVHGKVAAARIGMAYEQFSYHRRRRWSHLGIKIANRWYFTEQEVEQMRQTLPQ